MALAIAKLRRDRHFVNRRAPINDAVDGGSMNDLKCGRGLIASVVVSVLSRSVTPRRRSVLAMNIRKLIGMTKSVTTRCATA